MEKHQSISGIVLLAAVVAATNGCTKCNTDTACCAVKTEACCATSSVPASAEAAVAVGMVEGVPGGVMINTLTVEATVAGIDYEARTATLQTPDGALLPIKVGPEAVNFDLVQNGDRVKAVVSEELAIHIGDENAAEGDGAETMALLAEKGEQPGGMVAESIRATATVTAIDLEAHTATLQFADGTTKTVNVRPDVDLSQQKVGAKVVFEVTRMVALSVEKK